MNFIIKNCYSQDNLPSSLMCMHNVEWVIQWTDIDTTDTDTYTDIDMTDTYIQILILNNT